MADLSVVVIDSREKNMEIYEFLCKNKYNPTIDKLDVGDIMILGRENFLIERKTDSDFISSLIKGRLFTQMRNLVENADTMGFNPILLFIGDKWKMWKFRKIKPFQIAGTLNAIQFKFGIRVIDVHNELFAAMRIANLIDMFDPEKEKAKRIYPLRVISKKNMTKEEYCRSILEGFPTISSVRAMKILKYYGDLEKSLEAIKAGKIKELPGIGEKIADAVKKVF